MGTTSPERRVGALLIDFDVFYNKAPVNTRLVALAARYGIPASHADRETVAAGGLMSYLDDRMDSLRQAAVYAAASSRGRNPPIFPFFSPPGSSW
jgi:hypothetical protein